MKQSQDQKKNSLAHKLDTLQKEGIQADRKHLKQNMHTQFADPYEFARELVVNSYDALATEVYISGQQEGDRVKICFKDNGTGMDLEMLRSYFKIFRSRKNPKAKNPIGVFGVGKLSVAALPDIILFGGLSSTGEESWMFETDSLIEDRAISLKKVKPVPQKGTMFYIVKKSSIGLAAELLKIENILRKYVRFLDIKIYMQTSAEENSIDAYNKLVTDDWEFGEESLGKDYTIQLGNGTVRVSIGIGSSTHEVYQNKVFITSKYNLLAHDLKEKINIPYLQIRIDSPMFRLAFGRHILSNEEILDKISSKLRKKLLPDYIKHLAEMFTAERMSAQSRLFHLFEEMIVYLLSWDSSNEAWLRFPVFYTYDQSILSMKDLNETYYRENVIFLEASKQEGIDYSKFNAVILRKNQVPGAIKLCKSIFTEDFIDLDKADLVIELPDASKMPLRKNERRFAMQLGTCTRLNALDSFSRSGIISNDDVNNQAISKGLKLEINSASESIQSLRFKLNYLVERDGKTPAEKRTFLKRDNLIVLNLYNEEIRKLISLSTVDLHLAIHWTFIMILYEFRIFPHINPDSRDFIIQLDALNRINNKVEDADNSYHPDNSMRFSYLRNCRRLF